MANAWGTYFAGEMIVLAEQLRLLASLALDREVLNEESIYAVNAELKKKLDHRNDDDGLQPITNDFE